MHAAVRALMTDILDYAGIFPPAKLSLDVALASYLAAKKADPNRWMLGRFVCPTVSLGELLALARANGDAGLLSVAALGQPAPAESAIQSALADDLTRIAEFRRDWGNDAVIDLFEVALPKRAVPPLAAIAEALARANLRGFVEVPAGPTWAHDFDALTATIAPGMLGLKLRCGGLTAEAFPSETDVAHFIHRCSAYRLPWKATAGLHHPCRHWDAALGVWHQGFLNVFVAGILAHVHALTESDIAAILADRDGSGFRMSSGHIAWKSWSATIEQIRTLRECAVTTFGSCSFDEPCQDLLTLGVLDIATPALEC
ncbi:MAG: hypothetical protein EXS16_05565 [Gemmataceae bacterium]|nr:hypothetical protein [Gemmataceae bacterium]